MIGKVIKMTLGSSLLAVAVAAASPKFETNPMIGNVVMEMRSQLPETLDKARRAMGGN